MGDWGGWVGSACAIDDCMHVCQSGFVHSAYEYILVSLYFEVLLERLDIAFKREDAFKVTHP